MDNATIAAAATAAEARRLQYQEEEEMTTYTPGDLAGGWEFKILRANSAAFRKPDRLHAILEEEKRGGWVLVEKFDDSRIRLKRPAGAKAVPEDLADGYDPYRTTLGMSPEERTRMFLGIGATLALPLLFVLIMLLSSGR